jgi:hypothetical protein
MSSPTYGISVISNKQNVVSLKHEHYEKMRFLIKMRVLAKDNQELRNINAIALPYGNRIKLRKYFYLLSEFTKSLRILRENSNKALIYWSANIKYRCLRGLATYAENRAYSRERCINAKYLYENEMIKKILRSLCSVAHHQ